MKNGKMQGKDCIGLMALKAAVVLVFFSLMLPAEAAAAREGFFIGYGMAQVKIGGDMDGESYVGGGGSMEVMPDLTTETGGKYIIGFQSDIGSFEMGLTRSEHDGKWLGFDYPSTFSSLNLDYKFFLKDGFVRPLLLFGVGFTSLKVKNGSTDLVIEKDATFHGFDLRLGGGAQFELTQHFVLDAQMVYRWGSYNSVDGIASGSIEDDVDGNGTTTSLELKYIF